MRVQLINQTVLELGYYDDGPYEVAGEKQLNAALIPVPYHSYLGTAQRALPLRPPSPVGGHGEGPQRAPD